MNPRRWNLGKRARAMRGRTLLFTGALALLVGGTAWAAVAGGVADTGDGVCQPGPVATSNGESLTTVLYNPTQAQLDAIEDIDADNCDVGVLFDSSRSAVTLDELHIHGANRYGVFVDGPGPAVDIEDTFVFGIAPNQDLNGVQQGVGIRYQGAPGTVTRTQVGDYQKNGMVIDEGANVDVSDSDFRGKGPTTLIAQNGIQFSDGATGSAVDNVITEHDYTPKDTVAAGILLFNSRPADVRRHQNTYDDNEFNELICPAQNKFCQ